VVNDGPLEQGIAQVVQALRLAAEAAAIARP
jgi:hypothetical protein